MHVAGVSADPATFEHIDPEVVGNRRELLISELSGKGTVHARARDAGIAARRRAARDAADRARQGARAPRLPLRGRRRLVRAAAAQGDRRVRAAVPPRVLARDRREAGRRPRRDRGDDQDLGRRRALRAHRRGQRPGQRARPGAARRARRDPSRTCATSSSSTSRSGSSTRPRAPARSRACCSTPPTATQVWGSIGVSENVIEASWEALVDSLEYGMQAGRAAAARRRRLRDRRHVTERRSTSRSRSPSRCSASARRSGCSRCCAPGGCRSGRCCREFERAFAARVGAPHRERRLERHGRPAPGAARGRRQRRRRGHHEPVLVRRQRQRRRLRARAAGVRRHRPGHAEPRPPRPPPPRSPSGRRRCCRCTSSATRPTCRAFERLGLPIVEDACEALGAVYADGVAVGGRGHPAVFGFYANKQLTTGEGGMVTIARRGAQGADRLRAQPGPRAGHGLARPRPARLQLPPVGHRLRARARPARAARRDARRPRAGGRRCYREALAGDRGARSCRARTPTATAAAGSCSSSSCRAASTATASCARSARAGSRASPTSRRST